MILTVLLLTYGFAGLFFALARWRLGGVNSAFRVWCAYFTGSAVLLFAVVVTVIVVSKTAGNNREAAAFAKMAPAYPGASFVVHAGQAWIYETKDKPDTVVAYYEKLARDKLARIEKKDDFAFLLTITNRTVMTIKINSDANNTSITYYRQER